MGHASPFTDSDWDGIISSPCLTLLVVLAYYPEPLAVVGLPVVQEHLRLTTSEISLVRYLSGQTQGSQQWK